MGNQSLSIWALQAEGMKREDERRYNTFSVNSIYIRLINHLKVQHPEDPFDFVSKDFSKDADRLRMLGLHKSSIETLCYYISKENPSYYIEDIEKMGLYSLISRYEIYFTDFKEESEVLQKLKKSLELEGKGLG